ncbi:MAG TPA: DUF2723 domain-containing protein [Gemmatimonadaceae bacterium]
MTVAPHPARVAALAAASLLVVYLATLAPGVTFWDAGEFISAAATWGIPHPPGTPLYVTLLRAWSLLLPVPTALATNLFSAACTAAAGGIATWWLAPRAGARVAFAAAFVAGTMSSVWLNATETEVYAASLLLAVAMVAAGVRAGESRPGDARWAVLAAYLVVLAVPLHLSALVAAPAAIYAASSGGAGAGAGDARWKWRRALPLTGAMLCAMALSRMSLPLGIAGVVMLAWGTGRWRLVAAALLAATPLLILLLRARMDPWLNQGNPATWESLAEVVSRRQYLVAGQWPRRAPPWLQLANVVQYADWQVAMSLGRTVFATVPRVLVTALFAGLGIVGALGHRAADRRGYRVVLLLLACGTLGVMFYLNLQAGPSLGHGFVPAGAHEARERDYFFVLGFLAWGLWAGMGAIAVGERMRQPAAGVALALLPCLLNWRAVSRTAHPERGLPAVVAEGLLASAPRGAVLLAAGDNDSYPLWAAQSAARLRRDVTVVTVPLLPAGWYRAELARRHGLLPAGAVGAWWGDDATFRALVAAARASGRPVAASPQLPAADRIRAWPRWVLRGAVYLAVPEGTGAAVSVDTAAGLAWSRQFERWRRGAGAAPSTDPTTAWWLRLLSCPGALSHPRAAPASRALGQGVSDSLDSTCNFR